MSLHVHKTEPDVRIRIGAQTITWERLVQTDWESPNAPKEWRYNTRQILPLMPAHADRLKVMYGLPDGVVTHLVGAAPRCPRIK